MTDVAAASAVAPSAHPTAWKSPSGFGFRDLLDIVNPLQHIPIVSSVYRWLTGDRPGEAAQIAGDALYGGPIGVGLGLVGAAMEDSAGHDLGERALIAMFGPENSSTAVASAAPASSGASSSGPASSVTASSGPTSSGQPAPPPTAAASAAPSRSAMPLAAAVAARPPIPLYGFGGIAQPVPNPQAAALGNPERAFQAHQAMLERGITAGRAGPAPTAPVPLVLPAGTFLSRAPVAAASAPAPPNPAQPTDISRKMMDALDKYMQMERDRKDAAPPASGASVDLAL